DLCEDVPPTEVEKYKKEKKMVEKITNVLLPNHKIKVRFVKNREYKGVTLPIDVEPKIVYAVCFNIKHLLELEEEDPGIFMDVVAHELAHAEVFKNP
ncbi:420_t:CDS:1, partial [Ambispora leptoticha]